MSSHRNEDACTRHEWAEPVLRYLEARWLDEKLAILQREHADRVLGQIATRRFGNRLRHFVSVVATRFKKPGPEDVNLLHVEASQMLVKVQFRVQIGVGVSTAQALVLLREQSGWKIDQELFPCYPCNPAASYVGPQSPIKVPCGSCVGGSFPGWIDAFTPRSS